MIYHLHIIRHSACIYFNTFSTHLVVSPRICKANLYFPLFAFIYTPQNTTAWERASRVFHTRASTKFDSHVPLHPFGGTRPDAERAGKKEEWRERLRDAGMKPIRDAEEVSAKKDEEEMGEERWTGVRW